MVSTADASIGFGTETTYKTGVTPTRWVEYTDEGLDWDKNVKQGKGLRVGGRVARSARRVVPTAEGSGDFSMECTSKGMGLLWSYLMGAGTSTLVSAATYQQVFTLADLLPSFTLQKGVPHINTDGSLTVDAYTFLGATCDSFEIDFTNADILTLKVTTDIADVTTGTAYTAPSYAATPSLFHFAGGSISTGTFTAPTTTVLASAATPLGSIRGGSLTVNHNTTQDRYNFNGGGRKDKPTVGLRDISGKMDVEYSGTAFRDAVLNETPMSLVLTYTAAALGTGLETLQIALPELKFDSELPKTNGTDLITQSMAFAVLDNLSAAQPIWIVTRTGDTAL